MTTEEIALQVAKEWQMAFGGAEWDFALEVAKRAVEAEREACTKTIADLYDSSATRNIADFVAAIRDRSNAK